MKKLILVTLVLCMALSACTKAEVGKAPTAESAAASSVESTASGGKSATSEVLLPEKTKTAAHVTRTLSSGVVVDADVTMPESMQKTELPEMKGTGHEVAHEGLNMLAMPYALDVTDAGTPQPVLTLDEAIQKLEEKFDSMIVEGEWRVDEIEMAYIAVPIEGTNDARLLPVWRFQTEHTMEYAGKDDPSQTTTLTDRGDILFNALDGTELLKNNGSI